MSFENIKHFYYHLTLLSACVFGLSTTAISPATYKPLPSFTCNEPLKNVTALIYTDAKDSKYTLHTILNYRSELQDVHRLDVEPINIIPKLCKNSISNFPKLHILSLILTSVEDIEPGAFINVPQLKQLHLSHNKLQKIRSGVFNNLSIVELHLSGNRIYNIDPQAFDNMNQLVLLDLSFNKVQYIDDLWFKNSPKIATLNFIFNLIPELEGNSFKQLSGSDGRMNLWFMNNSISNIHKDAFKGIKAIDKLWLTGNKLRYIDDQVFNGIDNIDELNLADNEIFCLSEKLLNQTRVNTIYLSGNPIICNCMAKLEQWSITSNTKTYNSFGSLKRCGIKSKFIETTTQPPEGVLVEL